MSLSEHINSLEKEKFFRDSQNTLFVRVASFVGTVGNYDAVTTSYPNDVTEIYYFRNGGLTGTITKTITIIYTDNSKNNLLTVTII
jgi:hypothetical protein